MLDRLKAAWAKALALRSRITGNAASAVPHLTRARYTLIALAVVGAAAYSLYRNPPLHQNAPGELAQRVHPFTSGVHQTRDGTLFALAGLHTVHVFSLPDQNVRLAENAQADGRTVRYALDAEKLATHYRALAENIEADVLGPAVQGTIYKTLARYTVRENFSSKRVEIQSAIEKELAGKRAAFQKWQDAG